MNFYDIFTFVACTFTLICLTCPIWLSVYYYIDYIKENSFKKGVEAGKKS